ncbi:MAG TPA: hypothetical protein VG322_03705 [Candidatus Acidoferrales bacterium]|nr:hypothetical protein [Candidatus Acidoferrales bacterium]
MRPGQGRCDEVDGSAFTLSLLFAVMLRGCDFFDFARKSILKRIELRDKIRVSRNNVTLSERSEASLFAFEIPVPFTLSSRASEALFFATRDRSCIRFPFSHAIRTERSSGGIPVTRY